jgi:hypothetical protein
VKARESALTHGGPASAQFELAGSPFCFKRMYYGSKPIKNDENGRLDNTQSTDNICALAEEYLRKELGLTKEQAKDAENDLIGFFDVLLRIEERLKSDPVC